MRREQLILPPLTAFEVTIFRNEPLPYPAIYNVHILIKLQAIFFKTVLSGYFSQIIMILG